jgi:peptide-methionine (S)-S-oxide reductase
MLAHSIDLQSFIMTKSKKRLLRNQKKILKKKVFYKDSIVTEITPFKDFYIAEDYHKNYYEQHQDAPYCNSVIEPKIHKLLQQFGNEIKEEYN